MKNNIEVSDQVITIRFSIFSLVSYLLKNHMKINDF
jgi:hypothetical protein